MKKIRLLIVIMLALHIFTSVHADDDKASPNPNECGDSLSFYTQAFKNQAVHLALQTSMEKAGNKLDVPISTIFNWVNKKISVTLKDIMEEETVEGQIPIINLSYWAVIPQIGNKVIEQEGARDTIDTTAKKLGIPAGLFFQYLTDRNIQLYLMHTIAQRAKESNISDWVREYKVEMDKLQFPSRHVMSLLYGDGRDHVVVLALENGIERTVNDLRIPLITLSLLVLHEQNEEIRIIQRDPPVRGGESVKEEVRNIVKDLVSGRVLPSTLIDWLRSHRSKHR